MLEFQIHGLAGVVEKMRTLSPKLQKKGLRAAMRKGANIVRDAAKVGARQLDDPLTAESIEKNVAVQFSDRAGRREGGIVARVGVMGGAQDPKGTASDNPGGATWHWRFLEFGTSRIGATPFMRPALENNVERVTSVVVEELNVAIDKLLP